MAGLFFLLSCTAPDKEVFEESALAGEAVNLGCMQRSVYYCAEQKDGSIDFQIRSDTTQRNVGDRCERNYAHDYNCLGERIAQRCSVRCQPELGEECIDGRCIRGAPPEPGIVPFCHYVAEDGTELPSGTSWTDVRNTGYRGIITNVDSYDNYCDGETLNNWYCGIRTPHVSGTGPNAQRGRILQSCEFGCEEGACREEVLGCTDPAAENFNPDATTNDGSCEFCQPDSVLIELAGTDDAGVRIIERISQVQPLLTSVELPELLSDGSATNGRGTSPYTQQLSFSNENSEHIGGGNFIILYHDNIARYDLQFGDSFTSEVDDGRLEEYVGVPLDILGEEHVIVIAQRRAIGEGSIRLVLFSGPVIDTLSLEETRTYYINGVRYEVNVTFIRDDGIARFMVNEEATNLLRVGDTYVLDDGAEIGVQSISLEDNSVTFFLGVEKIELLDDNVLDNIGTRTVHVGSEDVDGTTVIITGTDSDDIFSIDSISVDMVAEDGYAVGVGELLSEEIVDRNDEPEVLFTQNWDIRLNEVGETGWGGILEIGRLCTPR